MTEYVEGTGRKTMKNIVIWSRDVDVKIGFLGFLALAAVAGFNLPMGYANGVLSFGLVDAFMAVAMGIFSWSAFEMIKPSRFTGNWRRWGIAELWVVPMVWVLLMALLVIWLRHFLAADDDQVQSILDQLNIQL